MISYIVPIYNAEKYLKQCIESVLSCLKIGDEIILIDDGSLDNSSQICDYFSEKYDCIKVEHLKNGGVSHARNRGIQCAKNEYIRFVDADDEITSAKSEMDVDLLIMDAEVVNEHNQLLRKVWMEERGIFTPRDIIENLSSSKKRCVLHYLWNHLYKRSIIMENQIWFDESVTLGEDFLFNCAYLSHCTTVEYIPIVCYRYFIRNSNSENLTRKFHVDELRRRRKIDGAFLKLFQDIDCSLKSYEMAEQLIGEITIGSLESIATKGRGMSINYIREYMREFYQTEYYEYLMKYIDSKSKQGKSEFFEYKMIKRKSCLVLYYYVRVRNGIRNRKKVK